MKIKESEGLVTGCYQTPAVQVLGILAEQPVMTASGDLKLPGKGPEGYEIDEEIFNW